MTVDRVWHRCRLATLSPARARLGLVEFGSIAADAGKIVYAGSARDAPTDPLHSRVWQGNPMERIS